MTCQFEEGRFFSRAPEILGMNLSQEQRQIRDAVREFAVEELRPVAAECDEKQEFP